MGQYYVAVNLDKKEYVNPHRVGVGMKLWEQMANHPSTPELLYALLACSNGRGVSGDLKNHDYIGRWAGDRIVVLGDYSKNGDVHGVDTSGLWDKVLAVNSEYVEISAKIKDILDQVRY